MLKASPKSSPNNSPIAVLPYDPQWPVLFAEEAAKIREALGDNCIAIHHIGSTSVPSLAAKPVIDIVPVVRDILKVDPKSLENLGYAACGEMGMLCRRFFRKPTAHLHIWEEGNPEIDKHLMFRDYLIQNSKDLKRYEALKLTLAQKYSNDRASYTLSKDDLVRELLEKAGYHGLTMVQALSQREWGAVRSFRQHYFFDPHGIQDPYTWTFDDDNHFHVVLLKGCEIVGYAHLQFWPDRRAALRIIAIKESERNQRLGRYFLNQLERWLAHQGIKSLHTQSSPAALRFYQHAGYLEIPFNDPDGYESDPSDTDMGKVLNS